MHGPPSISIPFPPFAKAEPPPPPPVVPPLSRLACGPWTKGCSKAGKLVKGHPYLVGAGAVLAVGVGLGMGRVMYRKGFFNLRRVWTGTRATVSEGMLKDAIGEWPYPRGSPYRVSYSSAVILAPSPLPPLLWPLAVSLLRAGYVVIIAVPHVDDAEQLEKRLSGVEEKNALRVLIYDAEDVSYGLTLAEHRSPLPSLLSTDPCLPPSHCASQRSTRRRTRTSPIPTIFLTFTPTSRFTPSTRTPHHSQVRYLRCRHCLPRRTARQSSSRSTPPLRHWFSRILLRARF